MIKWDGTGKRRLTRPFQGQMHSNKKVDEAGVRENGKSRQYEPDVEAYL